MATLRGSKYEKDGVWWIKFPLPPGQTWSDPTKPGKLHTRIEVSIRRWFRSKGIDGKGKSGAQWANKLLTELNKKYYDGERLSPMDHRTKVRDLMKNLIDDYTIKGKKSATDARQKLKIFETHRIADLLASDVTTDRLKAYGKQRMVNDGVESATVNRDFAHLRRAFRLGKAHTPSLVTEVPTFPLGEECKRRQGYLTLEMYDEFIEKIGTDIRAFFVAGCHLGVRVGALLQLRWSWVELWSETENDIHGIIRIPGKYMKNSDGLTTVVFGELGVELRRLKKIRDDNFPDMDRVFARWRSQEVRTGPVMITVMQRRHQYLHYAVACTEGECHSQQAADSLGISKRFMDSLVSRYKHDGRDGILKTSLSMKQTVADEHEHRGTTVLVKGAKPLLYGYAMKRWKQVVAEIGQPDLVMHDMRRTALDQFRKAGLTREECMHWLGHKTESMFKWYSIDATEDDMLDQARKVVSSLGKRRKLEDTTTKAKVLTAAV